MIRFLSMVIIGLFFILCALIAMQGSRDLLSPVNEAMSGR